MSITVPGKVEGTKRGASAQKATTPHDTGTAGDGVVIIPPPDFSDFCVGVAVALVFMALIASLIYSCGLFMERCQI